MRRDFLVRSNQVPTEGIEVESLTRVVEDTVKRPLTDELLFGTLQNGGTVVVDVEGDGIAVRPSPPAE